MVRGESLNLRIRDFRKRVTKLFHFIMQLLSTKRRKVVSLVDCLNKFKKAALTFTFNGLKLRCNMCSTKYDNLISSQAGLLTSFLRHARVSCHEHVFVTCFETFSVTLLTCLLAWKDERVCCDVIPSDPRVSLLWQWSLASWMPPRLKTFFAERRVPRRWPTHNAWSQALGTGATNVMRRPIGLDKKVQGKSAFVYVIIIVKPWNKSSSQCSTHSKHQGK